MSIETKITSPTDPQLDELCQELISLGDSLDEPGGWPRQQLQACAARGVFEWFVPTELGGQAWQDDAIIEGYLRLSAACLTTTFVITQLTGACKRIVASGKSQLQQRLLPELMSNNIHLCF